MTIDEAKAAAEKVEAAAGALNKAIADAIHAGMTIEVDVVRFGRLGLPDEQPQINVSAKIRPSALMA